MSVPWSADVASMSRRCRIRAVRIEGPVKAAGHGDTEASPTPRPVTSTLVEEGEIMKLTVHTFLTVDGVMQGPGGVEEDPSGGFGRGGWLVPYADQDMGRIVDGWFARAGAILLGRTTFVMMRDFWKQITDPDNAAATGLNGLPKYLVSNTVTEPDWNDTTVLSGNDVPAEIARLKERPGDELQVHGSCQLARTLHEAGLVDEYRLLTFPVAVGPGKRLFTAEAPATGFRLLESATTSTGATYAVLAPTAFTGGIEAVDGREQLVES
jgi:dihydrofolate reductase